MQTLWQSNWIVACVFLLHGMDTAVNGTNWNEFAQLMIMIHHKSYGLYNPIGTAREKKENHFIYSYKSCFLLDNDNKMGQNVVLHIFKSLAPGRFQFNFR